MPITSLVPERWINFSFDESPPKYGYQHNLLEGLGIVLMHPENIAPFMMQPLKIGISFFVGDEKDKAEALMRTMIAIKKLASGSIGLPFVAMGMAMRIVGAALPHPYQELEDSIIERTPPEKIDQLYELAKHFKEACNECNLNYMIASGTMLGARRHGGITPWDDDIDVFMMKQDMHKLKQLAANLQSRGIVCTNDGEIFSLTFDERTRREKFSDDPRHLGHIDIFIWEEFPDGRVTFSSPFWREKFPEEYMLKDELKHLKEWKFGPKEKNLKLKGIADPDRYLKNYYGQDCLEFGVESHKHMYFFSLPFTIPIMTMTKYRITDKNCAQGIVWKSKK